MEINLPASTPLLHLVALAHLRWPVEQFYEDGNGECGLGDYQGRTWEGLHHHLALIMLSYTFLMLQFLGYELQTAHLQVRFSPLCAKSAFLLFQDVVLWLIETDQVKAFRPRRN